MEPRVKSERATRIKKWKLLVTVLFTIASSGLFHNNASADGAIDLSGLVPTINTGDIIWANPNVALHSSTSGTFTVQSVVAALGIYSNDPLGFEISVQGLRAGGTLRGAGGANTLVPYLVALFSSAANASGGVTFLAAPGAGGTDSTYQSPSIVGNVVLNSGTLGSVVDTQYYVGIQIDSGDVTDLMADTYLDTLTISIVGN